ncbi:Zn-ribbon domain-containing OB-fold protein [Candidatus Thorarchaeota archaeon]|jgi:hypothetical protein|nr:MAG: Zn-ribbon domain-containing OB-fold protein [Candidatus Thorarchaeota archaeon]
MSEEPSIAQYAKNIQDAHYMAYKCVECGTVLGLPAGTCYSCGGSKMDWAEVSGKGKLVSFTVIHVAPDEFADEAPYFIAIIELEEGSRISARLSGFDPTKPEELKLGMSLDLTYEKGKSGKKYLAFKKA